MRTTLGTLFLFLGGFVSSTAQFATPTLDGVIGTNEYGIHTNGANQQVNGASLWFITWDANNLYVGLSGSNSDEGAVVYIDKNPLVPINGGADTDGNLVGQTYDNTNLSPLPFRADHVLYFKSTYRELRNAVAGNWSAATAGIGGYAGSAAVREFSIPWSAIGGRPTAFAWFGYVTTAVGSVYATMPIENTIGNIGTAARYERYYMVNNTDDRTASWPFSRNCFVFNRTTDWTNVGNLNVFDFTLNSPGRTIARSSSSATWIFSGSLNVTAGTISFEGSTGNTTIDNDLIVGQGASLNLSTQSSDLVLKQNLVCLGGLTANQSRITLAGNRNQFIVGNITFNHLTISKSGGTLSLSNDARVNGTLALINGHLGLTNTATLTIAATGGITGGNQSSYLKTIGTGWLKREGVGGAATHYPIGTENSFNPLWIANASGSDDFAVTVKPSFEVPPTDPRLFVNRQWNVVKSQQTPSNATITFGWNATEHGSLFNPSNPVSIYRRTSGAWSSTAATISGSGPYSATASGFSELGVFAIGNTGATSVENEMTAPQGFALLQNYPNPFNPSTEIRFSLDRTAIATLEVYNVLGQKVATLFNGIAESGKYHSVKFEATGLTSGTYFYRLSSDGKITSRKLLLTK